MKTKTVLLSFVALTIMMYSKSGPIKVNVANSAPNGTDLEMFSPRLVCKKDETNKRRPYSYGASFYIKNTGKKNVTIVSKISGNSLVQRADGEYDLNFTVSPVVRINDIPLIPSIVDFELVTLRPGEATDIVRVFSSKKQINKTGFNYNIADYYDQRFGYWTGSVRLDDVELANPERCKS